MGWCVSRSVPEGSIQWQFEFPFVTFIKVGGSVDRPSGTLSNLDLLLALKGLFFEISVMKDLTFIPAFDFLTQIANEAGAGFSVRITIN